MEVTAEIEHVAKRNRFLQVTSPITYLTTTRSRFDPRQPKYGSGPRKNNGHCVVRKCRTTGSSDPPQADKTSFCCSTGAPYTVSTPSDDKGPHPLTVGWVAGRLFRNNNWNTSPPTLLCTFTDYTQFTNVVVGCIIQPRGPRVADRMPHIISVILLQFRSPRSVVQHTIRNLYSSKQGKGQCRACTQSHIYVIHTTF
jgi:hypothetical protein